MYKLKTVHHNCQIVLLVDRHFSDIPENPLLNKEVESFVMQTIPNLQSYLAYWTEANAKLFTVQHNAVIIKKDIWFETAFKLSKYEMIC